MKTTPPVVPGAYIPMPWAPPLPRWERAGARGEAGAAQQLADIIRQETNDGRDIARSSSMSWRVPAQAQPALQVRGRTGAHQPGATTLSQPSAPDTAAHAPQPAPYPDTQHAPDPAPETTWSWKQE